MGSFDTEEDLIIKIDEVIGEIQMVIDTIRTRKRNPLATYTGDDCKSYKETMEDMKAVKVLLFGDIDDLPTVVNTNLKALLTWRAELGK